jgi:hypothetical protein
MGELLKYLAFSSAFCLLPFLVMSQQGENLALEIGPKKLSLPKVFQIGEYEDQYGLLYETYHDILLSVCNDDMGLAFDKWMDMIAEMEAYAKQIDFNLNGVKIWLKVFWNEDGTIQYISFYRKPNSINIDVAEMSAFLSSFMNRYKMPISTNLKFTHNASAQFPTDLIPAISQKRKE